MNLTKEARMRYLTIILGAGLLSAGLLVSSGEADAATPVPVLNRANVASLPVESVGYYYRRHYAYRHYYGYRPYYRPYAYRHRYYGYYGWRRPYYRWRY